jgi:hypothetical protein
MSSGGLVWSVGPNYAGASRTRYRAQSGAQLYTLFFAHIAKELGWILSMFVAGGATLGLAVALERMRRNAADKSAVS